MGNVSNIRNFFSVSKDKFVTTKKNTSERTEKNFSVIRHQRDLQTNKQNKTPKPKKGG